MKKLICIVALLTLTGCAAGSVTVANQQGENCTASYFSMFKASDEISLSACGATGDAVGSRQELSTVLTDVLIRGLSAGPK